MLHFDKHERDSVRHFKAICPDISIGTQVNLRELGNDQLEELFTLMNVALNCANLTPVLENYRKPINEILRCLTIDNYILSGNYYNDKQYHYNTKLSQEEKNKVGDIRYLELIEAAKHYTDSN